MTIASVSVALRPLALRMRGDLEVKPLSTGGRRFWTVKDPLSLRYYQLRDEELFVLRQLDGRSSLKQIQSAYERRFAPQRITFQHIQAFVALLHEHGLVVADACGQGEELLARRRRNLRQGLLARYNNPLAIRFRGIDPAPLLEWLYPKCRWMFSGWIVAACLVFIVSAGTLAAVQLDVLLLRLPSFAAFFSPSNLFWLIVALAFTKIVHELAHGLTCRHFGGECRELGFMLLAFTPCLYCNVSDAWMLPSKWKRIAISAAGMYVELLLAALCTFLWWFSEPGLLNALCLNVMFVCSVGTVVFNGNPLLRYDGYYILSDLVQVPNLAGRSRALVRQWLARWFAGVELTPRRMLPERWGSFLAAYGVASTLYRWFVMFVILWFCYQVLKPHRLEILAVTLAAATVFGLLAVPATRAVRFLGHPGKRREVKWRRLVVRTSLVAAMGTGLLFVRWPYRVAAPAVLEPEGAQRVYVSVPGTLVETVRAGTIVKAGQRLARLENQALRREVVRLRSQQEELRLRLENLESRRFADQTAAAQIPPAEQRLADIQEQLRRRLADKRELILTSPVDGMVLPASPRAAPTVGAAVAAGRSPRQADAGRVLPTPASGGLGQLPGWSGTPLDECNVGSFLETGTLFCLVGDPERVEAVLIVDQTDIELVKVGQAVEIVWNDRPGRVVRGTVAEISDLDLEVAPQELLAHEDLPLTRDASGVPRPVSASYQVRVRLEGGIGSRVIGMQGRAKIETPQQSLARRLYRYLSRTFRFKL